MWGYRRFKRLPNLGNPYNAEKTKLTAFIQNNLNNTQLPDE